MLIALASAAILALQAGGAGADTLGPVAVTPRLLATAFRDSTAATLLHRAREARARLDTGVVSYDAVGYQRLSMGVNVRRIGRERVLLRTETALRMRWHRDVGALVEAKGARTVRPGVKPDEANREMRDNISDLTVLPYYPGQEPLWIENALVQVGVNDEDLIHPLATGGEAYYTYETGDSLRIRLPDGTAVRLRELKVRPRTVRWDVIVGSLWLDVDRGDLARAVYRLTEPLDVWVHVDDDVPAPIRWMAAPQARVTAIVVEYGLYEGRFWLRRLHSIEAEVQANSMRVHVSVENRYRYAAVNGRDSLFAAIREVGIQRADSLRQGLLAPCEAGTPYASVRRYRYAPIPFVVMVPCDHRALATSAELPPSIYSADEALFDGTRRELVEEALGLGAQPRWGGGRPALEYGLQLARFNRVEGLSLGLRATQQLGAGYVADGTLRIGLADRHPNLELGFARTDLQRMIRLGGYGRLAPVGDWGAPLGFGSSVSALLWGRDDGFYFRATGVDLTGTRERGASFTWRLFAEMQRPATAENSFSFARLARGVEFQPNIVAERGAWAGASFRAIRAVGLDPRGWRALGDARLEAAAGETEYARVATDVTLSRALGSIDGSAPLAALTLSAGSSSGAVPVQRLWFLGGTHTVRGQPPGEISGDAYWFGRLELAQDLFRVGHLALFGDAGWAGPRSTLLQRPVFRRRVGDPAPGAISGAGVGLSLLDGLVRTDLAKGLHPARAWRTHLYLEARF